MKYYLYRFSDNWADEMDLEGFAIMTEKQKDIALAAIKRQYKKGGTICFGTNEDNDYDSLEDVLACISFEEISFQEYNSILKVFGSSTFGELGPLNILGEDEDEDEEWDEDEDYESEYDSQAKLIYDFIKKEYGLEETHSLDHHSKFIWKPTPKTEIEITIGEFDDGDEEVELTLRLGNKEISYDFYKVENIYRAPGPTLRPAIKELIEKAKKY